MRSLVVWLVLVGAVAGCAGPRDSARQPVAPKDIVWRSPVGNDAVVYLLRAPHDKTVLIPTIDSRPTASLPPDSYLVLHVPPGVYQLAGTKVDAPDAKVATLPVELEAGDRRFFYASTALANPDRKSDIVAAAVGAHLGLIGAVVAASIGSMLQKQPEGYGTHRWVECEDLDARGLASIAKELAASGGDGSAQPRAGTLK